MPVRFHAGEWLTGCSSLPTTSRPGAPPAANVVGVSDQTDLFHTMARALGLSG